MKIKVNKTAMKKCKKCILIGSMIATIIAASRQDVRETIVDWADYAVSISSILEPIDESNYNINVLEIEGDEVFKKNTFAALQLLKDNDYNNYELINKYLGKIKQSDYSRVDVKLDPPTFFVGDPTSNSDIYWYASCIAHDAYHSKLYYDFKKSHHNYVNFQAYSFYEAEMKCLDYQIEVLKKIGAPEYLLEHANSLIGTDWWSDRSKKY